MDVNRLCDKFQIISILNSYLIKMDIYIQNLKLCVELFSLEEGRIDSDYFSHFWHSVTKKKWVNGFYEQTLILKLMKDAIIIKSDFYL